MHIIKYVVNCCFEQQWIVTCVDSDPAVLLEPGMEYFTDHSNFIHIHTYVHTYTCYQLDGVKCISDLAIRYEFCSPGGDAPVGAGLSDQNLTHSINATDEQW